MKLLFLTFSCPSSESLAADLISGNNTNQKPRGFKKKKKNQTHYGPDYLRALGICIFFLSNVSRDVCPLESYPLSAYGALCPLDLLYLCLFGSTPSLSRLSLTPGFSFCLWAKASQISNLEIPPSAFSLVCPPAFRTIHSDVSLRCRLKLNVSKRNAHPLFTPLP